MIIKVNGGTLVANASNVQRDVLRMLVKLDPMRTPLLNWLILQNKKSKPVISPYGKFEWFRRNYVPSSFALGGTAITPSSSTWSLTSGSFVNTTVGGDFIGTVQVGDLVLVNLATDGYTVLKVNSNNGTTVVLGLVDASVQTTQGSRTILANSIIRTLGQVLYDGHGRLNYVSVQEENVFNYLKEFAYYVETVGRQQAGEYYTDGMTHAERVAQRFIEAKLEVERYLWFATLRTALSSGNNQATFGFGLEAQISTLQTYSTLTETTFRGMLKDAFKYGSGKKILYGGANLINDIEVIMNNKYTVMQNTPTSDFFKQFGLVAQSYATFSGLLTIVWNPIFDNDREGDGFILDEEQVILRYMADDERGSRKMRVRDNVGIGYEDKKVTEILFDVGIQVNDERTCTKIKKV